MPLTGVVAEMGRSKKFQLCRVSESWRSNDSMVTIANKTIVCLDFAEMADPKCSFYPHTQM